VGYVEGEKSRSKAFYRCGLHAERRRWLECGEALALRARLAGQLKIGRTFGEWEECGVAAFGGNCIGVSRSGSNVCCTCRGRRELFSRFFAEGYHGF
jgi:hypothetical protein